MHLTHPRLPRLNRRRALQHKTPRPAVPCKVDEAHDQARRVDDIEWGGEVHGADASWCCLGPRCRVSVGLVKGDGPCLLVGPFKGDGVVVAIVIVAGARDGAGGWGDQDGDASCDELFGDAAGDGAVAEDENGVGLGAVDARFSHGSGDIHRGR